MKTIPKIDEVEKFISIRHWYPKMDHDLFSVIRPDKDYYRQVTERAYYYTLFEYFKVLVHQKVYGIAQLVGKITVRLGDTPLELIRYETHPQETWNNFFNELKERYEFKPYDAHYNQKPEKTFFWFGANTRMLFLFFLKIKPPKQPKEQSGLEIFVNKANSSPPTAEPKPTVKKPKPKGLQKYFKPQKQK